MRIPNRGEIWLADLNPHHGTEPGRTRPVLIDAGHPSTYIIPVTTQLVDDGEPLRLRISAAGDLPKDSDLLMDQMRAIDNRRLVRGPRQRQRVMATPNRHACKMIRLILPRVQPARSRAELDVPPRRIVLHAYAAVPQARAAVDALLAVEQRDAVRSRR